VLVEARDNFGQLVNAEWLDRSFWGRPMRRDSVTLRAVHGRAVINLRDAGKLSRRQATAGIIDVESRSQTLLRASLINAIFIKTGQMRTPEACASPPDCSKLPVTLETTLSGDKVNAIVC